MPPSVNAQSSPDARASATSPGERELGALAVAATLGAAQVLCAQLSLYGRLQATVEPHPTGAREGRVPPRRRAVPTPGVPGPGPRSRQERVA
jgi:hypothetical protein